ncbi:SigE family RNA polymerase sigma factor [Streptomyces sp. NPDC059788]|uniref:SigE family RNA polymerase sigma factor n=1 Tax=Streptomyces sp. NPDC059788 TaxID=3346948 RepID=UPI003667B748
MEQEPDAFSCFVREVRPTLRRRAYSLCRDWHEADDLVQQTLIKIYRRWNDLDRHDEIVTYTRTVMVHTFISGRRAHRWSREVLTDRLPEPSPRAADQERCGDLSLLVGALAQLGARQRTVIVLRFWADLTAEQTAVSLGCSSATVRSQTSRALGRLRTILDQEFPAPSPPRD